MLSLALLQHNQNQEPKKMWIKEIVYNEEKFNLFSKPTIIMRAPSQTMRKN